MRGWWNYEGPMPDWHSKGAKVRRIHSMKAPERGGGVGFLTADGADDRRSRGRVNRVASVGLEGSSESR